MAAYLNKRNGKLATLVSEDSKFKTVLLQYEDGSTTNVSIPTFKRWWKCVDTTNADPDTLTDEEHVEQVMQQKKALGIECPKIDHVEVVSEDMCGDGTPLAEVGKEIAEQAVQKSEEVKASKSKKSVIAEKKAQMLKVLEGIDGISTLTHDKIPGQIVVKIGKKSVFEMHMTKAGITYNCRVADVPEGFEYHLLNNYYLPASIKGQEDNLTTFIEMARKVYSKEDK